MREEIEKRPASSRQPIAASASMYQKLHARKALSGAPNPSSLAHDPVRDEGFWSPIAREGRPEKQGVLFFSLASFSTRAIGAAG